MKNESLFACLLKTVVAFSITSCIGFLPDPALADGPTFVQERDNRISSGRSVSVTARSSTTPGNLIVVYVVWDNTGTASVSDSSGNPYSTAAGPTKWNRNRYTAQTFYSRNIKGGGNTITATFSSRVRSFGGVFMIEYSGIDQTAPLDAVAASSGLSGSLNSGFATTSASDLLFAAGASATTVHRQSDYSWRHDDGQKRCITRGV